CARARVRSRPGRASQIRAGGAIVKGGLIRKMERQDATETSQPPTSGPITNEIPVHAVQVPIAAPRSSPAKFAVIVASAAGVRSAPETPCRPRATINPAPEVETAQRIDVTPKAVTPSAKMRLPPKRSPSEPPTRMSAPSVSRYASTTHCWRASPPPRSRWIAGRATLTTLPSTKTMLEPRMHAIRTSRLRDDCARCSILADRRRLAMTDVGAEAHVGSTESGTTAYQVVNL